MASPSAYVAADNFIQKPQNRQRIDPGDLPPSAHGKLASQTEKLRGLGKNPVPNFGRASGVS